MSTNKYDKIIETIRNDVNTKTNGIINNYNHQYREFFLMVQSNIIRNKIDTLAEFFFSNYLFYNHLSEFYQNNFSIENVEIEGNVFDLPCIYVTFHLGSYKLINFILGFNQKKVCLVIAQNTLKREREKYQNLYDVYNFKFDFEIVDAEAVGAIFRMKRLIEKGYSLVLYLDGKTEKSVESNSDKSITLIKVLEDTIYAKKGAGILSYLLKIPIIPVISYFDSSYKAIIKINNPIYPDFNLGISDYAEKQTVCLWSMFSDYLKIYPEQWEAWSYFHVFLKNEIKKNEIKYEFADVMNFNEKRYTFIIDEEENVFLFDKTLVSKSKISVHLFKILDFVKMNSITRNDIGEVIKNTKLLNNLIEQEILI